MLYYIYTADFDYTFSQYAKFTTSLTSPSQVIPALCIPVAVSIMDFDRSSGVAGFLK